MENAVDAIVMAGEVLIFIVALTVCITSFNTVKEGLDNIIGSTDTITLTKTLDDGKTSTQYLNYISSENNNATRVVGVETVVTSIYRASKEGYALYIKLGDGSYTNYSWMDSKYRNILITEVKEGYFNESTGISSGDNLLYFGYGANSNVQSKVSEIMNGKDGKLYNTLKDKNFLEYLGEYQENTVANNANKETYRIITYVETT